LSSDQARKVTSTLNALTNDKQRDERANRGKKQKPLVKQASLKNDSSKDTTNYDDFDDDDDFM
jgi:translation initiation factor 3 subunit J